MQHGTPSKQLAVVNADDFGMNTAVNSGVVEAFHRGLVSSASLMANMPEFRAAVEMAHESGLGDRLGVHLNLTEGIALTSPLRSCPRFCTPDGTFIWRHRGLWALDTAEIEAIATEWRAQISALLAMGVRPSHLDSHHHVHTAWPLGTIAIALAREHSIPAVRLTRNCGPAPGVAIRLYKTMFNARLRRARLVVVSRFGSALDVRTVIGVTNGPVEVMTHPQIDVDGQLIDRPLGRLDETLGAVHRRITMVSHRELASNRVST
jgi:chitin disaccharide deacetylase